MKRAIELALSAKGHTSPNPMVGCVVVKQGRIISEACHEKYGEYHAERNALLRCKEDTKGADLYVTLEPCCHYGKTPPCTGIIIEKGIRRVYVGSLDSNPLVAGKGVEILQQAGIQVEYGILEEECRKMNEIFYHYISRNTPFTALKYAMTLDGKISSYTGDSKWVTSEEARNHVQQLRKEYSGIMVGIGTVLADNPMLNCRIEEGVDPVRIICDSNLRISMDSNIVKTAKDIKTIVAYSEAGILAAEDCAGTIREKQKRLQECGITLIGTGREPQVNLKVLIQKLGEMKIDSVLIEGGGVVNASALRAGIVNKVYAYIAPKFIMGENARSPVEGSGIELMKDALCLKRMQSEWIGPDLLVTGYIDEKPME
ncbi:MAG: bifunctional diaminohydroxyphosphoribosylaminopyrimidine deaminase/5-amino-6-(5-phosphoribosylamino)uracil reductase RibD [Lachnospiraceae bacterium]|nr:bifunctional diaminohydroxyphosphoribosylaminopyrimidine deaminase/5-amino-6-(5-phosphoribosylamino)uracil reductase RibD [Lachnospiraceae bacterium]